MNGVPFNKQQIPRLQRIRGSFHIIRDVAGKKNDDLIEIVVVRINAQFSCVLQIKKSKFFGQIPSAVG